MTLSKDQSTCLKILMLGIFVNIIIIIGLSKYYEQYGLITNKIHVIDTIGEGKSTFSTTLYPLSSDILPSDWNEIAKIIANLYNSFDAFVINASADNIPYLGSGLSFILENINKPIILTHNNIKDALLFASEINYPEVMILNNDNKLYRANRTLLHPYGQFYSPRYPEITRQTSLDKPIENPVLKLLNPKINIIVLKVFPGMNGKYLQSIIDNKTINGIILEIWNNGSIPTDPEFIQGLSKLNQRGVTIVAVSYDYEPDMRLLEAGVFPGFDMTIPAIYAKLFFLLSNVEDKRLFAPLLETSFRGEMTVVK